MWKRLRTTVCRSGRSRTTGTITEESEMPDIKAVYRKACTTAVVLALCADARAQCPSPCVADVSLINSELVLSTDGVTMRLPRLRGAIIVTSSERPAPFRAANITIRIDAAEARFSTSSLTALMNGYVLKDGAKIHGVAIRTDPIKSEVIIEGPVSLRGPLAAADEVI